MKHFSLLVCLIYIIQTKAQIINTIAGNGSVGYTGDGGPAIGAKLHYPSGLAFNSAGELYFSDEGNNVIRTIDNLGTISTLAGNGLQGYSGDGGLATLAKFYFPFGVSIDATGNIYISDQNNNRIRMVLKNSSVVNTIVGSGAGTYGGDGGLAILADIFHPAGITLDKYGDIYIADADNNVVRKVNVSNGIITTVAGNGISGYSGDGGQAILAKLAGVTNVALDTSGNIYIAGIDHRIRKVNKNTGIITTVVGNGTQGYSGDGGIATSASLYNPLGIVLDASGNIYVADTYNNRIRKVNVNTGIITTIVGNGTQGYSGDGGIATSASLYWPTCIQFDQFGNLYISDYHNSAIRKVGNLITQAGQVIKTNKQILLYPNPSNGNFIIEINLEKNLSHQLEVYNNIGDLVYKIEIKDSKTGINLSSLNKGLYFLKIFDGKQNHIEKVLIEN